MTALAAEPLLDTEPDWLVQLRADWDDRLAACAELVALGEILPERLEMERRQAAFELEHPEHSGIHVYGRELTREEVFNAADRGPEAPLVRTLEEQAEDLERLEQLAEHRKTSTSTLRRSWDSENEDTQKLLREMGCDIPRAEAAFDTRLEADIAAFKTSFAQTMQQYLPPKLLPQLPTVRPESRARTPRSQNGRRATGSRAPPGGDDDPPEPEPEHVDDEAAA